MRSSLTAFAATSIEVGHHITRKWLGLTFNVDTIYTTVLAGAIVIGLGLVIRRGITSGTPNKLQLAFEVILDQVQRMVAESVGPVAPFVVPLAMTLFMFILVANWLSVIPSGTTTEYLPPPTADTNLTFAMSLTVALVFTVTGLRHRGLKRYVAGFFKPPALALVKIVEEVAKPLSLSLRLFGNIFAGGVMVSVIALIPFYGLWPFNAAWKLFDMFIGAIQAFIFAFLTILYFSFAVSEEH
ncbi:MAG: F0F1 ATP synthase subunit A [Mycobacteriales bacterium]